jgi:outer membrane protein TolC
MKHFKERYRMKRILIYLLFLCIGLSGFAGENEIGIKELISLTLANDPQIKVYSAYSREKYYVYKSVLAGNRPQVTTSLGYSPGFYHSLDYTSTGVLSEYLIHGIPQDITYSQVLPTGGNISLQGTNTTIVVLNNDDESMEIVQSPSLSVSYSQPVLINGKFIDMEIFPATIRQSELQYLISLVQLQDMKNTSILNSLTLFYRIQELQRNLLLQRKWLTWENKKLSHLERRFELKQITDTDVWEMKVDIGDREEEILNLEHSLLETEKSFMHSLGLETKKDITFYYEIPDFIFSMTKEEILTAALSLHPGIIEQKYLNESAYLSSVLYETSSGNNHPQLSLSFSLSPQYSPNARDNAADFLASFEDLFDEEAGLNWSFSLSFHFPLYDSGKKKHGKKAVQALKAVAEEQEYSYERNIRVLCETLFVQRAHIKEKIELARDHMNLNAKKVEMEKKKRELNRAIDLDVEEAELWLTEQQNKLWRLEADYFLASCRLYSFTGDLLSEKLGVIPAEGVKNDNTAAQ